MSSQEIRDKFSLDRLGDAPIVQVDKRANLISVYEMAANSDNQGSEADQMINMTAETSDSAIKEAQRPQWMFVPLLHLLDGWQMKLSQ